jgi:hypothetical protein
MVAKMNILYYAAAATTAIAGILHLIQASNVAGFNPNFFIFFLVAGIAILCRAYYKKIGKNMVFG